MKYAIIANPYARNGRARKKLGELDAEMRKSGLQYQFAYCQSLNHASELSRELNRCGIDVIVAAGGDGTINQVLNGFFDENGKRISAACMGVVHIGTSPDFSRSYDVPTKVSSAVRALAEARTSTIAVGKVTFSPKMGKDARGKGADRSFPGVPQPGAAETRIFGCCANVGLGAAVARFANGGVRKYAGDIAGTFLSLVRVLGSYQPQTVEVELDGNRKTLDKVYNISVGKTSYIASGLKIRHSLNKREDRLYVVTVRNLSWRKLGGVLWRFYSGRPIISNENLALEYARRIKITSAAVSELEFDGDAAGFCPCEIETAPDPLNVIVGGCAC